MRRLCMVASSVVLAAAITVATASGLGGLSSTSLGAWDVAVSGIVPTVVGCDDFALPAATGTAIDGRPAQLPDACGGSTWQVHRGSWSIVGGGLVSASTSRATATLPGPATTDVSAEITVHDANASNREAGLAIDHSGASQVYLAVVVSGPGSVLIRITDGNNLLTLASAGVTLTSAVRLRATRIGDVVTATVDGVTALTYTLTAAESAQLAGGTRAGLIFNSGNAVRFSGFLITSASAP